MIDSEPIPRTPQEAAHERPAYLEFQVAERRFALPLKNVREVLRAIAIAPLPQAPAVIEGIINLRGHVVPVVDIRRRAGLPLKSLELSDRLIVVESGGPILALRVDTVRWVVEVEESLVASTLELAPEAFYLAGVAHLTDGLVLIQDPQRFLSRSEAAALAEAL